MWGVLRCLLGLGKLEKLKVMSWENAEAGCIGGHGGVLFLHFLKMLQKQGFHAAVYRRTADSGSAGSHRISNRQIPVLPAAS